MSDLQSDTTIPEHEKMNNRIPQGIQHIIRETETQLQHIYSTRLKSLILFGSYARGDFSSDSDIDVLLLLENMEDLASERARYFPVISQLSLKYDTVISIVPYTEHDFYSKKTPFTLNVAKEGVKI